MNLLQEKLIELVREESVLYDVSHADYFKKTFKDSIWARIGKDLNLKSGGEAKSVWLKLRNCHRDALRRKTTKSGSASEIVKPWKFEQQMQFLMKYMVNRPTSGNLTVEPDDVSQENDETEDAILEDREVVNDDISITERDETDEANSAGIKVRPPIVKKAKSKGTSVNDLLVKNLELHQERANLRHQKTNNPKKHDGLFHFFMSMYNTVKKMPHPNQLKVKRKIFNVVAEEEELLCSENLAMNQHLNDNKSTSGSSMSPWRSGASTPSTITSPIQFSDQSHAYLTPQLSGGNLLNMDSYMREYQDSVN